MNRDKFVEALGKLLADEKPGTGTFLVRLDGRTATVEVTVRKRVHLADLPTLKLRALDVLKAEPWHADRCAHYKRAKPSRRRLTSGGQCSHKPRFAVQGNDGRFLFMCAGHASAGEYVDRPASFELPAEWLSDARKAAERARTRQREEDNAREVAEALKIACPFCHAERGKPCVAPGSLVLSYVHAHRVLP